MAVPTDQSGVFTPDVVADGGWNILVARSPEGYIRGMAWVRPGTESRAARLLEAIMALDQSGEAAA